MEKLPLLGNNIFFLSVSISDPSWSAPDNVSNRYGKFVLVFYPDQFMFTIFYE